MLHDGVGSCEVVASTRNEQLHRQRQTITRAEVLACRFVALLAELADELFVDVAHGGVVDRVRPKGGLRIAEALDDQEQKVGVVKVFDHVVDFEVFEHVDDIVGESVDVLDDVLADVRCFFQQLSHSELGCVVEVLPGSVL